MKIDTNVFQMIITMYIAKGKKYCQSKMAAKIQDTPKKLIYAHNFKERDRT